MHQVGSGGGFPTTLEDLDAALQWLGGHEAAQLLPLDLPVALLGHSAGGHLATWLAMQTAVMDPMFPQKVRCRKLWS